MKKVFISYSSKNKELIDSFKDFLVLGMGVEKKNIFCTIDQENLASGEPFIEKIREELQECGAVISVITEEYLQSKFCLIEMGAAWAMGKKFFPMITVPYEQLQDTPIYKLELRRFKTEDISAVYDELFDCGIIERHQTAQFTKRLPDFIKTVDCQLRKSKVGKEEVKPDIFFEKEHILVPDSQGYYRTEIEQRRPVKGDYRCYKIKGQLANPLDRDKASSEWLFYWKGVFPDLEVGDIVRFKTSKTEVKVFRDIGNARNIYPDDLQKL